ncbi:MAG: glycosyltransferase family 4 protein [Hyphomicrobium sp.]
MKILLSAFSCGPGCGSEPGIGWNWALEAARQGHDVTVITQTEFQDRIEQEIASGNLPKSLRFDFFMPPLLAQMRDSGCRAGFETLTWQSVHLLWQIALLGYVRRTYANEAFDIVHHITLGGIRHPTRLGRLGIPLVLGPLGGGERAPLALRKSLPWGSWLKELARDAHTSLLALDPMTRRACADAVVIYAKTRQTADVLPRASRRKVNVRFELGTAPVARCQRTPRAAGGPIRLMYAGQFVFWKGMHLGLRAVAEARARGHDVHLTMVGSGPDEPHFRRLADAHGIEDIVTWRGQVPYSEIGQMYAEHDALLFPSLHDSSGNVVLEALTRGLPVICLDLGGPAEMVTESCGRVVASVHSGEAMCVAGLADAIGELAQSPALCARLSEGALSRSRQFLWPLVVGGIYSDVEHRLKAKSAAEVFNDQSCPAS